MVKLAISNGDSNDYLPKGGETVEELPQEEAARVEALLLEDE